MRLLRLFVPCFAFAGCAGGEIGSPARQEDAGESALVDAAARPDLALPGTAADLSRAGDSAVAGDLGEQPTPDDSPDGGAPPPDLALLDQAPGGVQPGGVARVTAGSLNLRSGASTMFMILAVMPCGARVDVIGGPSAGWWNLKYQGQVGWASGTYLVAEAAFNPAVCGAADGGASDGAAPLPADLKAIFDRCKLAVGYSYYWGHGSWRADGQQPGACMGNCPNCTHSAGPYGADCSGLVAKCWQIPQASPITTDLHPYSTYNFYNQTTHWAKVARNSLRPGDALVYNANGAGHMLLFESGNDPWGALWVYEARGCSWGVVHNLRAIDKTFIAIRREGL